MNQLLWDQLFPFHIRINSDLEVISVGKSLKKLTQKTIGSDFSEIVAVKRPRLPAVSYENLSNLQGNLLLLTVQELEVVLRGQVVLDGEEDLVFCVSPWMTDAKQMEGLGLNLRDFALHDPIMDLLQLLSYHAMSIDELRMQAVALEQAKEDAEVALRARSDFLSVMTHEIRTPLNAVIGMANQLLEENPRPDQLDSIKTLRFSGDSLLALVNDILDYSKLEAGKIELELVPVNLKDLLENIRKTFEPLARKQQIDLLLETTPELPDAILGDFTRISQVLFNLVGNAIKFTPQGKVRIRVSTREESAKKAKLLFEIIDTGVGIPKDKLAAIFDDFVQITSVVSRAHAGTGLGLSISRKILQLHNSDIHVTSHEGEGSVFSFELLVEKTQTVRAKVATELGPLTGLRVLLVEDNQINVKIAARYLKKWGTLYEIAHDGNEAVQHAAAQGFDVILMDLLMPEKDGYEATQEIRSTVGNPNQNSPIIALSASLFDDVRKKALKVGLSGFLDKPFRPETLHQTLAAYYEPVPDSTITPN